MSKSNTEEMDNTVTAIQLASELSYERLLDEGSVPELFRNRNRSAKQPTGFPRSIGAEEKLSIYRKSVVTSFWNCLPSCYTVCNGKQGPYTPVNYSKIDLETLDEFLITDQTVRGEITSSSGRNVVVELEASATSWKSLYMLFSEKKLEGDVYNTFCILLLIGKTLLGLTNDYLVHIALVSPLHGVWRETLEDWDNTLFIREMGYAVDRILYRRAIPVLKISIMLLELERNFIGGNVKKRSLVETLGSLRGYRKPIQLFLSSRLGNTNKTITTSAAEIKAAAEIIAAHEMCVFVHAPYTIRLAAENDSSHALLYNDLLVATKMGVRGVVVHTASNTDAGVTISEAENRMYRVIKKHLMYATEKCPILLETPAKEGRELVTTLKEFVAFYKRFTEVERRLVRICVDTCHVFSAGHHPLDYLRGLHEEVPGAVALVHFNGSATRLCGKHDCHSWTWRTEIRLNIFESLGWEGFDECVADAPAWMRHRLSPNNNHPVPKKKAPENVIPLHDLYRVAEWCKMHAIPALVE